MDKPKLRTQLKQKRQSLNSTQVNELSQKIILSTWQIVDWSRVDSLHCFLPLIDNNEINTLPLLRAARQVKSELKTATSNQAHETFWLDGQFKPTKKIPDNFQFGLIFVPMLGFDKFGYRLGYGGGFYDKFLASQYLAQIIGVCYEFGKLPKLPREEHDIPLPTVITEKSIYKF